MLVTWGVNLSRKLEQWPNSAKCFKWALTEHIDTWSPINDSFKWGGKQEGDFCSKLESDSGLAVNLKSTWRWQWPFRMGSHWTHRYVIYYQWQFQMGGELEGDFCSKLEGDSGLAVNLKSTWRWQWPFRMGSHWTHRYVIYHQWQFQMGGVNLSAQVYPKTKNMNSFRVLLLLHRGFFVSIETKDQ